jgi:hypothetical protein
MTVTISKVTVEDFGDDTEQLKFVAWFEEVEQGLILNRTNSNSLEELSGSDESDDWTGLVIDLFVIRVDFNGKRTPAIRIEAATGEPSAGSGAGGQKPLPLSKAAGSKAKSPAKAAAKTAEPESDSGDKESGESADAVGFDWAKGV